MLYVDLVFVESKIVIFKYLDFLFLNDVFFYFFFINRCRKGEIIFFFYNILYFDMLFRYKIKSEIIIFFL